MTSIMPPVLVSSPSNSITTTTTQSSYCSLKKALIPLLCILIGFLINTNYRGLYLEYSGNNHNNGLINPIVRNNNNKKKNATDGIKIPFTESEKDSINSRITTPVTTTGAEHLERLVDAEKKRNNDMGDNNNDNDMDPFPTDPWVNDDYTDDAFPSEEECVRNTTNYYRPPNITTTLTTMQQQLLQRKRITKKQDRQSKSSAKTKKKKTTKKEEPSDYNAIPRRLIFTYHTNLFDCSFPQHLYDNVQNTIQVYADHWGIQNKTKVNVLFFDDDECERAIQAVEPRLLPVFMAEENGAYRGDICRVAALYLYGGYYLDVDIQPIKALDPPSPKVDFITAEAGNKMFFQAVLAVKPRHVLMKHTLETMLNDWYMIPKIMKDHNKTTTTYDPWWFRGQDYAEMRTEHVAKYYGFDPKHHLGILMGPATLRIAFERTKNQTTPWFLEEIDNRLQNIKYPTLVRDTPHWGCNFLVHDNVHQTAYFYSRCVGTALCPDLLPVDKDMPNDDGIWDEDASLSIDLADDIHNVKVANQ